MVQVLTSFLQLETHTQGITSMDNSKAKANTPGKMGKYILVNLLTVSRRDTENGEAQKVRSRTVTATREHTVTIKRMVKVSTSGLVVMYTTAIMSTMKEAVKAPWLGPMVASMKASGIKASNMAWVE